MRERKTSNTHIVGDLLKSHQEDVLCEPLEAFGLGHVNRSTVFIGDLYPGSTEVGGCRPRVISFYWRFIGRIEQVSEFFEDGWRQGRPVGCRALTDRRGFLVTESADSCANSVHTKNHCGPVF